MASTAPQDNGGSLRKSIGLIELFTFWTCEPIRPAQAFQIGSAGGIIGKNPLKIGKRCWKAAGVHSGKLSPIHRIGNKPDRQSTEHSCGDTEEHLGNSASVGPTEVQFIDADAGGIDLSYVDAGLAIKIRASSALFVPTQLIALRSQ